MNRRGASRISDFDPEFLAALNTGQVQTRTLAEALAIDHSVLLTHVVPDASQPLLEESRRAQTLGISRRTDVIGAALQQHRPADVAEKYALHTSDTVRGWSAFATANTTTDGQTLLAELRTHADDDHFAVREWAWMAARPKLQADLGHSISLLSQWWRRVGAAAALRQRSPAAPSGCGHATSRS